MQLIRHTVSQEKMTLGNWLRLLRHVKIRSFDKEEIIIQAGSSKKEVFFIRKGLIRSYFTIPGNTEMSRVFENTGSVYNIPALVWLIPPILP
jgi:signal-transduction protein with cAMP-binding, CBS, and nucleotidyltransferase domain